MNLPGFRSAGDTPDAEESGVSSLEEQLKRLALDDELGQLVQDGLNRLSPAEQTQIAADLRFAFDALKPALAQLHETQISSGVHIGNSVIVKGQLTGSEDLTVDGIVEGNIELRQHVLTVGASGQIKAQVFAKSVIILGEVTGNVTASESVDIRDNGSVDGDIASPRVKIAEGAHFRGSIDMQRVGVRSRFAALTPAPLRSSRHEPSSVGVVDENTAS
jgi:cytoskeletal protein CcmA (bactofilin family)